MIENQNFNRFGPDSKFRNIEKGINRENFSNIILQFRLGEEFAVENFHG